MQAAQVCLPETLWQRMEHRYCRQKLSYSAGKGVMLGSVVFWKGLPKIPMFHWPYSYSFQRSFGEDVSAIWYFPMSEVTGWTYSSAGSPTNYYPSYLLIFHEGLNLRNYNGILRLPLYLPGVKIFSRSWKIACQ